MKKREDQNDREERQLDDIVNMHRKTAMLVTRLRKQSPLTAHQLAAYFRVYNRSVYGKPTTPVIQDISPRSIRRFVHHLIRRGFPIVPTNRGYVFVGGGGAKGKKIVKAYAYRLLRHGAAEIRWAREVGGLPVTARLIGQLQHFVDKLEGLREIK